MQLQVYSQHLSLITRRRPYVSTLTVENRRGGGIHPPPYQVRYIECNFSQTQAKTELVISKCAELNTLQLLNSLKRNFKHKKSYPLKIAGGVATTPPPW
jgi:hypothetical protein